MSDNNTLEAVITAEYKQAYLVYLDGKEFHAQVCGKLLNQAVSRLDMPVVGDKVAVTLDNNGEKAVIREVLHRKSLLLRKQVWTGRNASGRDAQPLAANIDMVFIIMGLDGNYNLARLERLLVAAWDSNAAPAVILTKKDLCPEEELPRRLEETAHVAPGVAVISVCALTGEGLAELDALLKPGFSCCFIGSSGVGKSTLLNRLCGCEIARTMAVREDDSRGRHTTTVRRMYFLPCGARVIDTPGIREFSLEGDCKGIGSVFSDIEELAALCKFKDCSHDREPGCAVKEAIVRGEIAPERLKNYWKMLRDKAREGVKRDPKKRMLTNRQFKAFARRCRDISANKRKLRGE